MTIIVPFLIFFYQHQRKSLSLQRHRLCTNRFKIAGQQFYELHCLFRDCSNLLIGSIKLSIRLLNHTSNQIIGVHSISNQVRIPSRVIRLLNDTSHQVRIPSRVICVVDYVISSPFKNDELMRNLSICFIIAM